MMTPICVFIDLHHFFSISFVIPCYCIIKIINHEKDKMDGFRPVVYYYGM